MQYFFFRVFLSPRCSIPPVPRACHTNLQGQPACALTRRAGCARKSPPVPTPSCIHTQARDHKQQWEGVPERSHKRHLLVRACLGDGGDERGVALCARHREHHLLHDVLGQARRVVHEHALSHTHSKAIVRDARPSRRAMSRHDKPCGGGRARRRGRCAGRRQRQRRSGWRRCRA